MVQLEISHPHSFGKLPDRCTSPVFYPDLQRSNPDRKYCGIVQVPTGNRFRFNEADKTSPEMTAYRGLASEVLLRALGKVAVQLISTQHYLGGCYFVHVMSEASGYQGLLFDCRKEVVDDVVRDMRALMGSSVKEVWVKGWGVGNTMESQPCEKVIVKVGTSLSTLKVWQNPSML